MGGGGEVGTIGGGRRGGGDDRWGEEGSPQVGGAVYTMNHGAGGDVSLCYRPVGPHGDGGDDKRESTHTAQGFLL